MPLTINIVYTPGTVRYLSFFVRSLLEWSDGHFRLVSNGCPTAERRHLEELCRSEPRLEAWALPTPSVQPHSRALDYLQTMTAGDSFCFMDSDIFATGEFLVELEARRSDYAGVFSGSPIWVKRSEEVFPRDFRHLVGTFNTTATGECVGSTYFALLDNRLLKELRESTGVGFGEYSWRQLSQSVQERLADLGLEKDSYDTGKVLYILLRSHGHRLGCFDSPHLCHIGGVSFQVGHEQRPLSARRRLVELLERIGPRQFDRIRRMVSLAIYRRRYRGSPARELELNASQRGLHRDPTRQFMCRLIESLLEGRRLPEPPAIEDAEIDANLRLAARELVKLHGRYPGGVVEDPQGRGGR